MRPAEWNRRLAAEGGVAGKVPFAPESADALLSAAEVVTGLSLRSGGLSPLSLLNPFQLMFATGVAASDAFHDMKAVCHATDEPPARRMTAQEASLEYRDFFRQSLQLGLKGKVGADLRPFCRAIGNPQFVAVMKVAGYTGEEIREVFPPVGEASEGFVLGLFQTLYQLRLPAAEALRHAAELLGGIDHLHLMMQPVGPYRQDEYLSAIDVWLTEPS